MKTLAITIGNNNYCEHAAKLENAINDAQAMADVFRRLGYDVFHYEDCSIDVCVEILTEFDCRIEDYDATIFYYAGHGFQLDGENYLASVDCQVANPNKYHCSKTCMTLTEILDILRKSNNKVNIVIIDACRKSFERGGFTSFTPIQAPKGTLIAFSTSPNEGANDRGFTGHSIYTGSLLQYIGREWMSIEELFKRVRKTVFNLSEGKQTTWEHTSLIGDFYFNTGQLVHSIRIPYDETVVKDSCYVISDKFGRLIKDIKSYNWHIQNSAIHNVLQMKNLDKNQQFLLGRNLQQANDGGAFAASGFFSNLRHSLIPYFSEQENHLLNGILFEIYFDKNGEFRKGNFKNYGFEKIFELRKDQNFRKSFEFLTEILEPYKNFLFYIPSAKDSVIDVDLIANTEKTKDFLGSEQEIQVVSKVIALSKDITRPLSDYGVHGQNSSELKAALSNYLFAPIELIRKPTANHVYYSSELICIGSGCELGDTICRPVRYLS
jgi:hypothetical protein